MLAMQSIKLMVVDDHSLFRRGLLSLLSQDGRFEVIGEAGDMGEALRLVARVSPDLILLDNHLPGVRGVDGITALKEACPGTRILMLTVSKTKPIWLPRCRPVRMAICSRLWNLTSCATRSSRCWPVSR